MEGDGSDLLALAALKQQAQAKEADFETRKRMRVAEDFQSDKGETPAMQGSFVVADLDEWGMGCVD